MAYWYLHFLVYRYSVGFVNNTPENKVKVSIIEPGGLNIELAILFASKGHDVAYYSEFHEAFPMGQRESVGYGFKGVERCTNLNTCIQHGDIIVCPDTHSQQYIDLAKSAGKPWWGTGRAERMEQDRLYAKEMFATLQMPVGPYKDGNGVDSLEALLQKTTDLFVKFPGSFRGAAETKHHQDWKKTKREWWGSLLSDLGPEMDTIGWVAEEPIEHVMEVAADQMVARGEYSLAVLVGIEDKDSAYIGKIMEEVPVLLQSTNDKLSSYLRSCQSKTFFSPELMIGKDGKAYLTDPCLRTGHPVSAVQFRIYSNLCDYIIAAALNKPLPKIVASSQYGIALEIKSTELDDSWLEVQFEEKHRNRVHLQNCQKKDDAYYVIPKAFIAATIVGLGNSIADAEKQIHEVLDGFSCNGMYYDLTSIEKIKKTMVKGKNVGIDF